MVHNEENRRGLTGLTDLPFLRSPLTEFRYLTPASFSRGQIIFQQRATTLALLDVVVADPQAVRMISNSRAADSQLGSRGFYWAT